MNMVLFLLTAFLLPLLSLALQAVTPVPFIRFLLYGVEAASPSIAAAILLVKSGTFKRFCREMFHREKLALAVLFPIAAAGLPMLGAKLVFCAFSHTGFALGSISPEQFIIIAWALVAEELGWRGYFEPALKEKGLDRRVVPFLVGIVWGLWHYHYFLTEGLQVPIVLFFAGCIIESYLYSLFMDCTGQNLVSAMIYHFAWNFLIHFFAVNPADNQGSPYPYILLAVLEGLALLALHLMKNKRTYIF